MFSLVVLTTLGLYGLLAVVLLQPQLIAGILGHDIGEHVSQHFRLYAHRIHDITFSLLIGTSVIGMLAQLRRPARNIAGQLMALIPWVALTLAFVISNARLPFAPAPILATLTILAAILHPARHDLVRFLRVSRVNWVMLGWVIIAAVPLVGFAGINIGLQRTGANDHAALGHYGFMAAFSLTVIGVGILASVRPEGWKITAWVAGLAPAFLGLASVLFPDVDSNLGRPWALAAMIWGVVFLAVVNRPAIRSTGPS